MRKLIMQQWISIDGYAAGPRKLSLTYSKVYDNGVIFLKYERK